LRDGEDRAARLRHVEIHLSLIVLEDSQLDRLSGRVVHRVGAVARLDAGENQEPSPDLPHRLAGDPDGGAGDALEKQDHPPILAGGRSGKSERL